MSAGNAEGLGKVREKELLKACAVLKISADAVTVIDDPALQVKKELPM